MKTSIGRIALLLLLATFASQLMYSQVAIGTPRFNSYGGGPFDTVNLGNLNVHFTVPIIHKAGRGLPFNYDLAYDSSVWKPVTVGTTTQWSPALNWGWQQKGSVGYITYTVSTSDCQYFVDYIGQWVTAYTQYFYTNWTFVDDSGVSHPLTGQTQTWNGGTQPGTNCAGTPPDVPSSNGTATDGSGYTLSITNYTHGVVTTTSGNKVDTNGSITITDSNGNKITSDTSGHYYDTLSSTTPVLTVSGWNFTYTAPGGSATIATTYKAYTVKTNFGVTSPAIAEYGPAVVNLIDFVQLPDGSKYTFTYETTPGTCSPLSGTTSCVTARIASVKLPTGGQISYTYTGGSNGITRDGSAAGLTRTVNGVDWAYTRTQVSGNHWQTKVTTPPDSQNAGSAPNDTIIDFQKDSATSANTNGFFETKRQAYQGTSTGGTLLLTIKTCWNFPADRTDCTGDAVTSPISHQDVMPQLNGGLQGRSQTFFDSTRGYIPYQTYLYAFSSTGLPTTPLQVSGISYATLGNNILDRPSSISTTSYDGSAHVLSQTTYTYDEYSTYPLQSTNGTTPQQTSITGARGNATTITSTVIGAATLSRHVAYYDTGTPYQSYDVNGAITTYNYDTTVQGNSTKSCGNSFPTSVTLPISGLSSLASTTYDCIGGVATAATDLNGNATTSVFTDLDFWRPDSVTDPTGAKKTFTYTAYDPATQALSHMTSKVSFNTGMSVVEQLTTFGKYGQPLYSQQREGPSSANYDSTQVLYDSFLRAYKSSMPCVSTVTTFTAGNQACPTAATTTSNFDALNRVTQKTDGGGGWVKFTYNQNDVKQEIGPVVGGENTKKKQLEYDALGRLTSVCELTNLTGSAQCGQNNPYNGYMTTYAYGVNASNYPTMTVTQGPAGSLQTRIYTYDLLGRLISEQNPENATTQYFYDNDPGTVGAACSTVVGANWHAPYNGNLAKKYDAKGNTTCYTYDAIHRVTGIYYSGPDSGNTQTKTFVYDAATFNSTAMSNAKGHLAEAYTGASGSKTTDEFFSYSLRGEVKDTWQCTPHSGTSGCAVVGNYYHVSASFWAHRALKTLSSSITNLPTQTYGVDPMGRTNAVTASAGQNPVTSISFDLTNFQTNTMYGSLDSDVVTFDPNTGRMAQYKFNVNTQNVTGNLTWNANGSLATLAITNQLNSLDTQTCNYTHDDLQRISSVGCLNGSTHRWDQNFTYDAFGNITKQVPVGGTGLNFLPTYDTSKNWLNALPGCTPSTDPNGRVTNDCTHSYAWDSSNKMHSVDASPSDCSTSGQCLTYDALGRMVEKRSGATYTQIVYGPKGRFATMNGQALVKAFIPLPGGQAVYTAASLNTTNKVAYYRHADHLGSSRLATTPTRTMYSSTAYAPFGEPYSQAGATDLSFTGQEQDTVSGIHDFLLRKFVPLHGRWLSPDPAGLAAANPANPQSWNRYAYVMNNPMAMIDALGEDDCYSTHNGSDQCGGGGGPCYAGMDGASCDNGCSWDFMSFSTNWPDCGNTSNNGGNNGGGGGGSGNASNCNSQCQVQQAELAALMAMTRNSNCAALIGGPTAKGQADAIGAVGGQLFGNPNPFIQFNTGPDSSVPSNAYATTRPAQVPVNLGMTTALMPGAQINLGSGFYTPPAGYFGSGSASELAQMQTRVILEEFGHAMGYLSGVGYGYPGSTGIREDNPTNLSAVSIQNGQNVQSTCINQPGNVPLQSSGVDLSNGTIQ